VTKKKAKKNDENQLLSACKLRMKHLCANVNEFNKSGKNVNFLCHNSLKLKSSSITLAKARSRERDKFGLKGS
jgi:hypothetical protein